MPQQTVTIEGVPDGFELTGEYRAPLQGECYWNGEGTVSWLLKHYEGCWLFRAEHGSWYVTNHKPLKRCEGCYCAQSCATSLSAIHLAALHNATFTPPPVNKIQVKRT